VDAEVRGRALEGLGFAYEQKGNLDESIKTFKDLEVSVDVLGFKELAMYHQARVLEARNSAGDKDKAKELLKTCTSASTSPARTTRSVLEGGRRRPPPRRSTRRPVRPAEQPEGGSRRQQDERGADQEAHRASSRSRGGGGAP